MGTRGGQVEAEECREKGAFSDAKASESKMVIQIIFEMYSPTYLIF
jgi:hypothetical protein